MFYEDIVTNIVLGGQSVHNMSISWIDVVKQIFLSTNLTNQGQ